MDRARIKNVIEVGSNVAVIVGVLIVLAGLARGLLMPAQQMRLQSGLHKGTKLPQLPGVDLGKSKQTLLVAMDSRCDYCKESLPWVKDLTRELRSRSNDIQVIFAFAAGDEADKRFAQEKELNANIIFGIDFKAINVSAIPAIILLDDEGAVVDFWIGRLSQDTEAQISSSLARMIK